MSEKDIIFDLNMYSGGHDGGQKMRVLCSLINDAMFGIICPNSCYVKELKLVCESAKSGEDFTLTIKHCKSKNGFVFDDETGTVVLKNYLGGTGLGTQRKNSAIVKLLVEVLQPEKYELLDPIKGPRDHLTATSYEIETCTTLKMYFSGQYVEEPQLEYDARGSSLMNICQCVFTYARMRNGGEYTFKNVLPKSVQKVNGKKQELAASVEWTKFFFETFFKGCSVSFEPVKVVKSRKKRSRRIPLIGEVKMVIPEDCEFFVPTDEELNTIAKGTTKFLFDGSPELAKEFIVETLVPFLAMMGSKKKFVFEFNKSLEKFHTKHVLDSFKTFMNVFIRGETKKVKPTLEEIVAPTVGSSVLEFKIEEDKDGKKHLKIPTSNISIPKATKQVEVTKVIVGF